MPATSPRLRLPYPVGSDRVSTLDDIGKALVDRLEELIPPAIRQGKVTISNIGRMSFQNFSVNFSSPMPSTDYTVIITLGGSGMGSPELMAAAYKPESLQTTGFAGRIRNNSNSSQSCEISYVAIAN